MNEYSLWLEPKGEEYKQLKNVIIGLSTETQSPAFDPHVTLLGGITMPIEEITKKMKILMQGGKPITLSFITVQSSKSYYKSIFLKCKKTRELMDLNYKAQKIFSISLEYHPHLSLLYSDAPKIIKEKFLEEIGYSPILSLNFRADSISLWHARGTADQWQKITEFCF